MSKIVPNNNEKFLSEEEFIVSKTDTKGRILYGNKTFISLSGYEENEILAKPHSILRHPDMPKVIFKFLWERVQAGEEIFAYVKNMCKDGSYYWVLANVTATKDKSNNTLDFHSVRRKPSKKAMDIIPSLYKELLETERNYGIEASKAFLLQTLDARGESYDDFIFNLQN